MTSKQAGTGAAEMTSTTERRHAPARLLVALGAPAMALAMTVTVISTYLPVLVQQTASTVVVGALVSGEGFFGIFMPGLLGSVSDRSSNRVGDRLGLLLACAVAVVVATTALGLVALADAPALWWYVAALAVVYAGYYGYLAPYWALYPDLVPDEQSGRSRSVEGTWRVTGVGLALVGGGLLLDVARGLPFLVAAGWVTLMTAVLVLGVRPHSGQPVRSEHTRERAVLRLLRDHRIRNLCLAEGLWNFALSSLRAFVVLFFVLGLGHSSTFVSTVIFPLVAVGIGIAAPTAGWLADRHGHLRVLTVALVVYAVGMAVPGFVQANWVMAMIPVVAMGAATVMTLPFSVLMRLLSGTDHGAASGLFGLCRGVGATLGPIVTGIAIVTLRPVLASTHGYAAMWLTCSAALLLSIPLLRSLDGDERVS